VDKTAEISDNDLAQRVKLGEKTAFRQLFERYAPRIYRFSRSYLKNENDSEELVQNVFLKLWEKRDSLDTSQNLKAFIFKIAVNTIYDFVRRKNIEHAFEDYARLNYQSSENSTWHSVIYAEMEQNLHHLVAQLPEQQQKIFQLSKTDGLANDEIAKQLGLSKRTVENHLYRALAFLKKHLKDEPLIGLLFFYLVC
jgi:RNA polymerase sigma-70 factor (ECF subfamily)